MLRAAPPGRIGDLVRLHPARGDRLGQPARLVLVSSPGEQLDLDMPAPAIVAPDGDLGGPHPTNRPMAARSRRSVPRGVWRQPAGGTDGWSSCSTMPMTARSSSPS